MTKDKEFIVNYKGTSTSHTFAGGSNTECKRSIINSMKRQYDDFNEKEVRIIMK